MGLLPSLYCHFPRLFCWGFFLDSIARGRVMLYVWTKKKRACSIYPVPRIFDEQSPIQFNFNCKHLVENNVHQWQALSNLWATHEWTQLVSKLQVKHHAVKLQHTVPRNPVAVKTLMGPRKTFSALCVNCDRAAYWLRANFSGYF